MCVVGYVVMEYVWIGCLFGVVCDVGGNCCVDVECVVIELVVDVLYWF